MSPCNVMMATKGKMKGYKEDWGKVDNSNGCFGDDIVNKTANVCMVDSTHLKDMLKLIKKVCEVPAVQVQMTETKLILRTNSDINSDEAIKYTLPQETIDVDSVYTPNVCSVKLSAEYLYIIYEGATVKDLKNNKTVVHINEEQYPALIEFMGEAYIIAPRVDYS